MLNLGVGRSGAFRAAFYEQLLLSLAGPALGVGLYSVARNGRLPFFDGAVITLRFLCGTAASPLKTTSVNVTAILSAKE